MKNIIFSVLKRVCLSICMIYTFNLIGRGLNIFVPINIITVSVTSLLGISGLLAIIGVYFVVL